MQQSLGDFKTLHGQEDSSEFSLAIGSQIGDYIVLEILDKGGMGEVYRVQQIKLGTEFALKVLSPTAAKNELVKSRFEIEARIMAALSHSHIIKVYYCANHAGTPYMVMDLVRSLNGSSNTLEKLLLSTDKLPEEQAAKLLDQLCLALDYIHSYKGAGIIHRDLKPANILLDKNMHLFLTDFGLAKVNVRELNNSLADLTLNLSNELSLGDMHTRVLSSAKHDLTMEGAVLGTYDYMAPEVMDGQEATVQSDIYAVGIILYKMLTGRIPRGKFKAPSAYSCSVYWDRIISSCLETEATDRPKSISEIQELLEKRNSLKISSLGKDAPRRLHPPAKKQSLKLAKANPSKEAPRPETPQVNSTFQRPQINTSSENQTENAHLGRCDTLNKCLTFVCFVPLFPSALLTFLSVLGMTFNDYQFSSLWPIALISFVLAWTHQERQSFLRLPALLIYLGLFSYSALAATSVDLRWAYLTAISICGIYCLSFGKKLFDINSFS